MEKSSVPQSSLSREQTVRGLKLFYGVAICWGVWGRLLPVSAPIFVAYALHLGLAKENIGLFASISMLMGVAQVVTAGLGQRVKNRKLLILFGGLGEMLFPAMLAFLAFLPGLGGRSIFLAFILAIAFSGLSAHIAAPVWNSFFLNVVPDRIRGRYMAKRLALLYVTAIIAGLGASRLLDWARGCSVPGILNLTFAGLLLAGFLIGSIGYVLSAMAPEPRQAARLPMRASQLLRKPFRYRNYARIVLFNCVLQALGALAAPYYLPFMYDDLRMDYTSVAFVDGTSMTVFGCAYLFWGVCIDRFGSKPVLQQLLVLNAFTPLFYIACAPGETGLLYCGAVTSALASSGIALAYTALLYRSMPKDEDPVPFFAVNAALICVSYSLGGLGARLLLWALKDIEWQMMGMTMNHFRTLFLIGIGASLLPLLLLSQVREERSTSVRELILSLARGNLFGYAYNYLFYNLTASSPLRAQAILRMGRSRSPMAVDTLTSALDDPDPDIRSSAAVALGETRLAAATGALIGELEDRESDLRPHAAEALGKIRHHDAIEPLFRALDDSDPSVRCSAIRALADIGGSDVLAGLHSQLDKPFDREVFPSLIEALSHLGDHGAVLPALNSPGKFRSQVIRLQLLNCVCRALGADNRFYRILMDKEFQRTTLIRKLLEDIRDKIRQAEFEDGKISRETALSPVERALDAYTAENHAATVESLWRTAQALRQGGLPLAEHDARFSTAYQALDTFISRIAEQPTGETRVLFAAVIVRQMAHSLRRRAA